MLPFIVEPVDLHVKLTAGNLLIVDLCGTEKYREGHIPGAIHLDPALLMHGDKSTPGLLPSLKRLSALFANLGLTEDAHVVCYDDVGGTAAGRLIWTLDVVGHTHSSFLNGGIAAWLAEGFPLQAGENFARCVTEKDLTVDACCLMTADNVLSHLHDENFLVWDARSYDEYTGIKMVSSRGGHIPGAIHCEWTELLDRDNHMRFRKDLAQYLQQKGITPDKQIVTHCQTHRRSALAYVAAKSLGYPRIAAYPGSWSEWGNDERFPIHTGESP